LCGTAVQYKPFHNQLAKREFPTFVRLLLSRLLDELACRALRFGPDSPFSRFEQIRMQDGTSFAVKRTLAATFPGRFTTVSPAAVELHVDMDLASEMMNRVVLSADKEGERQFLPPVEEVVDSLLLGDRGYFGIAYLTALDAAGGFFIVRGKSNMNPLILKAIGPDGHEVERFRNRPMKTVASRFSRYAHLDLTVRYGTAETPFVCRIVVHPNLRADDTPRYLVTNLDAQHFTPEQISDGYRLRWQIELLFKEWKSHANLHAFDTSNPYIAEGLIWASLCAATVKRYYAHITQRIAKVPMSTQIVAKCIHHVLSDIMYALMHSPRRLTSEITKAIDYLSANAQRAHPKRDRRTGRLKLGLEHDYAAA